jgi:hypothetical protein
MAQHTIRPLHQEEPSPPNEQARSRALEKTRLQRVSTYASINSIRNVSRPQSRRDTGVKFTTLIPTTWNDETAIKASILARLSEGLWRPFGGMTNEGFVSGHWIDEDGTEFHDTCVKVSIECDRSRLQEAIKAVRRIGRRLKQRAMYFEVSGYDGLQVLRIE